MAAQTVCPVSEVAGDIHHFIIGTGETIEWDVMGDNRKELEVCTHCAEPLKIVNI